MNACMASHILKGNHGIITDKLYKECVIKITQVYKFFVVFFNMIIYYSYGRGIYG